MIGKVIKIMVSAAVLTCGIGAFAADEQPALDEQALNKELAPIMMAGKAPDPKVLVALFEKYRNLKSGRSMDTLLMATITSYVEADRVSEGIAFADKVLADSSISAVSRQSAGVAKAYAHARLGAMSEAETALDAAFALAPDEPIAGMRDSILKQLQGEAGKRKKPVEGKK